MPTALWLILMLILAAAAMFAMSWAAWRYWWFWRNPARTPPEGEQILSPADGTVVYVRRVEEDEPVLSIKRGRAARVSEITRASIPGPKLLIGVFMSPLDVHYNRAPLGALLEYVRQYPARGRNRFMAAMFWRTLLRQHSFHAGCDHIVTNNRTVTRWRTAFRREELSYWIVQIGAASVAGIDVFPAVGDAVERGEVFGMIRIGSQVDLILPLRDGMRTLVMPGDRVRAGASPLVE